MYRHSSAVIFHTNYSIVDSVAMLTPEQLEIAKKVYRIWGRYRFYSLKVT